MDSIIIPARAGSTRLPNKNHVCVPITIQSIPPTERSKIILTTDDDFLIGNYGKCVHIHRRSKDNCTAEANMQSVLTEVVRHYGFTPESNICVLYPTYITRQWKDVLAVERFFLKGCYQSALCRYPADTHPYMCIDNNGKKYIDNDVYRGQELPPAFAYSHYVIMLRCGALPLLDKQLMCKDTGYYLLDGKPQDIDRLGDLCALNT